MNVLITGSLENKVEFSTDRQTSYTDVPEVYFAAVTGAARVVSFLTPDEADQLAGILSAAAVDARTGKTAA